MQNADLLEIYTFGDVVIQWRTKAARLALSPREALLLIYLAYQRVPVSRAHLCHLFWPADTPLRAHGNLRKLLVDVRKSVNDLLVITREEVALHPELSYWLDVHEFQWQMQPLAQAKKAGNGSQKIALPRLLYGIQLYTGEFLGSIKPPKSQVFATWLEQAQADLYQQVIDALKIVIESCRQNQHDGEAMHYAKRLLTLDPFDEEAHEQVMLLWAHMGCLDEARQHYQAYCQLLKKELATTPEPHLVSLYQQLQAGKTPSAKRERKALSVERQHSNGGLLSPPPKPLTPLFGRADTLQQLQQYLADPAIRLVTVVGMGGVGKTQLALTLAEHLTGHVGTHAVFVALHDLLRVDEQGTEDREQRRDGRGERGETGVDGDLQQTNAIDQLALATATALHLPMTAPMLLIEHIGAYLHEQPLLLIFDGFEQMAVGAPFLTMLLQAAPLIKVLVTTREGLQMPGEAIIQLEGLARPTPEEMATLLQQQPPRQAGRWMMSVAHQDALAQRAPSLQLFFHCLQRQTPGIAFQAECLQNMIQICHLVEGNPLAIELAAGLASHYSWGEIADRLQRNLDILSTTQRGRAQRQRSMTTVLEASWRLLALPEQAILVGLSVFADSFSRTAALAVTGSTPEILMALVNKSWVRSKGAGRYELPRLIRLFTAQRLHSVWDEARQQALQAAHACYYLDYLQEEIAHRQALADASVIGLLAYESGNLLTACTWVHQHGTPQQRQQYVAILALLRRCTAAATPALAYGASMVWAASPLLSLVA